MKATPALVAGLVGILPARASAAAAANSSTDCCRVLQEAGLKNVLLPGDSAYSDDVQSYWSVNAQLTPSCFVQPENAQDVSTAVKALVKQTQCKFAVRSGGHETVTGANNIVDGVTIDLSLLNGTTYDPTTGVASILTGSRWLSVYRTLDPLGRGVSGGRVGVVGTGGFLLGGGISINLEREGLGCDAVVRFEVVLANGEMVEASAEENADLYQALKGGANNFGIVTRFDVQTFPNTPIYGGALTYPESASDSYVHAVKQWTDDLQGYPNGSATVFWTYQPNLNQTVIINRLYDVSGQKFTAPIFDNFLSIPGSTNSTMATSNMSTLGLDTQPAGYRNIWFALTLKNDERLISKAVDLHHNLVDEMKADSSDGDFITDCLFHSLPTLVAQIGAERGGNILGIDRIQENAVIMLGQLAVKGADQEAIGRQKMIAYREALEQYSSSLGGLLEYIYINYADETQDPLDSYGEENVKKMLAVSEKYDPDGIFQTRVPGGFKLPGRSS